MPGASTISLIVKCIPENKSSIVHQSAQQHTSQSQPSQNHHNHQIDKTSPVDRPYLGQTSLLPATSTSAIKSEPGYEYSCIQNQPTYPYQQIFGFAGATNNSGEVAYHHQHHVTAAAKLMASS